MRRSLAVTYSNRPKFLGRKKQVTNVLSNMGCPGPIPCSDLAVLPNGTAVWDCRSLP